MKLKLLVAALALSASGIASASAVAVTYEVYNLALADTHVGGSVNGFVGNGSDVLLSSPANYWIKFSVDSHVNLAGATAINWDVQAKLDVRGGVKADGGLNGTPVAISVEQLIGSTNVAAFTDSSFNGQFLSNSVSSTKVDNLPGNGVPVAAGDTYSLDPASKLNVDSGANPFGITQTDVWVYMWGDNTTTVVSSYSSMIENYALAFATADVTFSTPEPTTALLAGLGLLGAATAARRRKA